EISDACEKIPISSQHQRSSVQHDGKLITRFKHEPRRRGELQAGREINLTRTASGHGSPGDSPAISIRVSGFENRKQLLTGRLILHRQQHVFEIGIDSELMARAKSVPLNSQRSLDVRPKNESSVRLRIRHIGVQSHAAVYRAELLADKLGRIEAPFAWRSFSSGRQFHTYAHRRLTISPHFERAIEAILAPKRDVTQPVAGPGLRAIIKRSLVIRDLDLELKCRRWRVRHVDAQRVAIDF